MYFKLKDYLNFVVYFLFLRVENKNHRRIKINLKLKILF